MRRLPTECGTLKGVPNKVTAEVKAIAQEHGPEAFKRLVKIIKSGTSEAVSQGSLDRAFGKSPQALVGDPIRLHNKIEFVIAARTSTEQTQTKTAELPLHGGTSAFGSYFGSPAFTGEPRLSGTPLPSFFPSIP